MSKRSFVIYESWGAMIGLMSDETAGQFIKAITKYAFDGIYPTFENSDVEYAFGKLQSLIDLDIEKYEAKKKRIEAARLSHENKLKTNKEPQKLKSELKSEQPELKSELKSEQKKEQSELKSVLKSELKTSGVTVTVTDTVSPKGDKTNKPVRHKYGEYAHVLLTDSDYNKLCEDYGDIETGKAIRFLDEYKERKGYKSKNDYLTIKKWVLDAVREEKRKSDDWSDA